MQSHQFNQPLYWLSPHDPLTALMSYFILITGSPGSGKSSTAMMQILLAYLRAGFGGLFLASKAEDTANYIAYVKQAGRERDLKVFGPDSGLRFDPISYLWNRPGRGAALLENIVDYFVLLMAVGSPHEGKSNEPFWERKAQQAMRAAIMLLHLADEAISIFSIDQVIATMPTQPGQYESPEWAKERCGTVINKIRLRKDSLTERERRDFTRAVHFACFEWPGMDERVRSSVLATWTAMADRFLYEPFLSIFSAGVCDFTPEDITERNQLLIVDWPALDGGDTYRIASQLLKLVFMDALVRRDVTKHPTPIFLAADECQLHITQHGKDERFLQVARSARCLTLYATQNIMQLAAEFGETQIGPKTRGWLGTASAHIAFQQNDPNTRDYIADVIGKDFLPIGGRSIGNQSVSFSSNYQLTHRCTPALMAYLPKPDQDNPTAAAVVYCSGQIFHATRTDDNPDGEPYLVTEFSRRIK